MRVSRGQARTSPWATLSVMHASGTVSDSGKILEGFSGHGIAAVEATLKSIGQARYTTRGPLTIAAWTSKEPLPFDRRQEGEQCTLHVGYKWGGLFDCAWMRFRGHVPAEAAGQPVALLLDVNGEMCIFDERGVPLRGLTSLTSEFDFALGKPGKRVLPLTATTVGPVEIWADCGCNDLFGNLQEDGCVRQAALVIEHSDVEALYYE